MLILTTFGRPGYLRRAMESGVVGYLVKGAPASELATAIHKLEARNRIEAAHLALQKGWL